MATRCRAEDDDGNVIAEAVGNSNNSNSRAVEKNGCLMKLNSKANSEEFKVKFE